MSLALFSESNPKPSSVNISNTLTFALNTEVDVVFWNTVTFEPVIIPEPLVDIVAYPVPFILATRLPSDVLKNISPSLKFLTTDPLQLI